MRPCQGSRCSFAHRMACRRRCARRRTRNARNRRAGAGKSRRPRARHRAGRRFRVRPGSRRRRRRRRYRREASDCGCGRGRRRFPSSRRQCSTTSATAATRRGGSTRRIDASACKRCNAAAADFSLGSVGAGRGAKAGCIKGRHRLRFHRSGSGLVVGALVAVNSIGSALMPDGTTYWAWAFELDGEFGGVAAARRRDAGGAIPRPTSRAADARQAATRRQHDAGVVACSAALSTVECKRVAMMAHDGIARAVRPAHTPFDGDTVFALASAAVTLDEQQRRDAQVGRIGSAAADCTARAIARAAYHSQ